MPIRRKEGGEVELRGRIHKNLLIKIYRIT